MKIKVLLNKEAFFALRTWQGWASVACLAGMLFIAVKSLLDANWVTPAPAFYLVGAVALAAGVLLGLTRLPSILAHLAGVTLGLIAVAWQGIRLQPYTGLAARFHGLTEGLSGWWQSIQAREPAPGTIQVALLLCLFCWLIGYLSAYYLINKQNAWVAVTLGAVGLLINLSFLPAEGYGAFTLYLGAAALLIISANYGAVFAWFGKRTIHYAGLTLKGYLPATLALIACAAVISTSVPRVEAGSLYSFARVSLPLGEKLNALAYNFFARVPAQKPAVRYQDLNDLYFREGVQPTGEEVCVIQAESGGYFWTKKYDIYTSAGWHATQGTLVDAGQYQAQAPASSEKIEYTVTTRIFTEIPLLQGDLVAISIPAHVETLPGDGAVGLVVEKTLKPNARYKVTAYLPSATVAQLAAVGENYPAWVKARYLQLPDDFPKSVRALAARITEGAATPYEKITALKLFLDTIPYNRVFDAPPWDADAVENFLFKSREGDCVYFASAMTVMLRSLGVPARLASGYVTGDRNEALGGYLITTTYAHAWPEVYFPGYGWIPFEATPGVAYEYVIVPSPGEETPEATEPPIYTVIPTTISPAGTTATVPPSSSMPSSTWTPLPTFDLDALIKYYTDQGHAEWLVRELVDRFIGEGYTFYDLPPLLEGELNGAYVTPPPWQTTALAGSPEDTDHPSTSKPAGTAVGPGLGNNPDGGGGSLLPLLGWSVLAVFAATGIAVSARRLNAAWYRRLGIAGGIYAQLRFFSTLSGLGAPASLTPLEHAARLSAALPDSADDIQRVVAAYVMSKYSRTRLTPDGTHLSASWRTLRSALIKHLFATLHARPYAQNLNA